MAAAGLQLAEAGEANLECAVTPEEIAIFTVMAPRGTPAGVGSRGALTAAPTLTKSLGAQ